MFNGWACSYCAWKWPLQDRTSDSDRMGLDMMRYTFTTHRCEDFVSKMPTLVRPWRIRKAAPVRVIGTEEYIAVLIAVASMIWTVELVTNNFAGIARIGLLPPGPAEICAIAMLVWIHAKWRLVMRTRFRVERQVAAVHLAV